MFTDKEKQLLKHLVKTELDNVTKEEKTIRPPLDLLEVEELYNEFLKNLLNKL